VTRLLLRGVLAGAHTPDMAAAKAHNAVSFRASTEQLNALAQAGQVNSAVRHLPGSVFPGRGVPEEAAQAMVGGGGVSEGRAGSEDDASARAGIAETEERLLM